MPVRHVSVDLFDVLWLAYFSVLVCIRHATVDLSNVYAVCLRLTVRGNHQKEEAACFLAALGRNMAGLRQETVNLYQDVRERICRSIFTGDYQDGELILPERKLAEELNVSRVTVRKALDMLEKERIIARVQGSGTRVSLHYGPRDGSMDIITVAAPAQNEFFARMIDAVQTRADLQDSLVLFQQKPAFASLENCLYRIYKKGLRNLILWKEDMEISGEMLRRLKGLGMNIVLFDAIDGEGYVDAVCLDNEGAVKALLSHIKGKGCQNTAYVGWDNLQIGSLKVRENTFRKLVPAGQVIHIPYRYHSRVEGIPKSLLQKETEKIKTCDSVIYAVGELGIACEGISREQGISRMAGMIGMMPGARELGIYVVEQDFQVMADQIFKCLKAQNTKESGWKAKNYRIGGIAKEV